MLPPRTYEVQAGYALALLEMEAVVSWAADALVAGFDSRSLRILAGLEPPLDQLEVGRLYSMAFTELGIRSLAEKEHIPFYIASVLRTMLSEKIERKKAMKRLADLHIDRGYDSQLRDFYLLYHAKSDLKSEEVQWYWQNADRSNIDQVVDEYAKHWLANHPDENGA